MNSANRNRKSRSKKTSQRNNSPSWGIVGLFSVVSLLLGLVIGAVLLNSSSSAVIDNDSPQNEQLFDEASRQPESDPEPQLESQPPPAKVQTAEEQLKASMQAAIDMIGQDSVQMFVHSHLSSDDQSEYQRLVAREGKAVVDEVLAKKVFNEYRLHLQSAVDGVVEINPAKTVAIVTYKLKELPDSGLDLGRFRRDQSEIDAGVTYPGLGDDLSMMLEQAVELLEDGKLNDFVENVYPLSEVERLSVGPTIEQLLIRIKQPAMVAAMIRDLKEAARSAADIQDDIAVVTLPPVTDGDPERTFKFELSEGNWRFIDLASDEKETLNDLSAKLPASMKKENSGQTIVFERNNSDSEWRIRSLPDSLPEW